MNSTIHHDLDETIKSLRERPTKDEYFIAMALLASSRGTCIRRKTGCILVDKNGHVLATGYNGPPKFALHCIDKPCKGANLASGQGLHVCEAIHAEENALLQCRDTQAIYTAYCTASPCLDRCIKLLQNTSCLRIVYYEAYPGSAIGKEIWERSPTTGRSWEQLK